MLHHFRPALCALLIFVLAGCHADAPDPAFTALRDTPPSAGMARVVVYYPSHFLTEGDPINLQFGGTGSCKLKTGTYLVREIEAGRQEMRVAFCGTVAGPPFHMDLAAGKKYYFRVRPYDSSLTGVLSGYPRVTLPYEDPHPTPFEVVSVNEAEALEQIEPLERLPDK